MYTFNALLLGKAIQQIISFVKQIPIEYEKNGCFPRLIRSHYRRA